VTESERLFTAFCEKAGIPCVRVATASDAQERRPDYRLTGRLGTEIVAEVKQFDPSAEERAQIERAKSGESVAMGCVPGARLRQVVDRANAQLKALSRGTKPGILVVYNNVWGMSNYTDSYAVLTAMRGLDVVPVLVPEDPSIPPTFLDSRPGPKKKLRADANTHISAIAVLFDRLNDGLGLAVYHNRHARLPLEPADIDVDGVVQFRMRADQSGWDEIESAP
jgi:hypothetical protein